MRAGFKGKAIDFDQLESISTKHISFDPNSKQRRKMIHILERSPKDPERRDLVARLGAEFGRIYVRYRRNAERALTGHARYGIFEKDKQYAEEAAINCVVRGVTPRQLIEYWHTNIRTFADRSMSIPPLSIIKAAGCVDQVACQLLEGNSSPKFSKKKDTDSRPEGRNSFSDPNTLDRRFRPQATKAGFDLSEYSDRYLVTLQKMAISKAQGERVFISSKLEKLVSWLATNLYADSEESP
jgi:hypothetical protein